MKQPVGTLTFSNKLIEQVHRSEGLAIDPAKFPILHNENNTLPSFQIFRKRSIFDKPNLTIFKLVNYVDGLEIDLSSDIGLIIKKELRTTLDWIESFLYTNGILSQTILDNIYYIVISDGIENWYSDVFKIELGSF